VFVPSIFGFVYIFFLCVVALVSYRVYVRLLPYLLFYSVFTAGLVFVANVSGVASSSIVSSRRLLMLGVVSYGLLVGLRLSLQCLLLFFLALCIRLLESGETLLREEMDQREHSEDKDGHKGSVGIETIHLEEKRDPEKDEDELVSPLLGLLCL